MPKGFSDKEKALIKKSLISKGKLLFSAYGLKKTSIEDLTKAVGIAQGSFYNFFNSKEELYFEILELEEDTIKQKLLDDLKSLENNPKEYFKNLFRSTFELIKESQLITQLYQDNTLEILSRKLPEEMLEKHLNKDRAALLPLIEVWQANGIIREEKVETIIGLIRSIFILSLHEKEIGERIFEDTINLLIDLISEGLVLKEG